MAQYMMRSSPKLYLDKKTCKQNVHIPVTIWMSLAMCMGLLHSTLRQKLEKKVTWLNQSLTRYHYLKSLQRLLQVHTPQLSGLPGNEAGAAIRWQPGDLRGHVPRDPHVPPDPGPVRGHGRRIVFTKSWSPQQPALASQFPEQPQGWNWEPGLTIPRPCSLLILLISVHTDRRREARQPRVLTGIVAWQLLQA